MKSLERREFLKASSLIGGGLLLGAWLEAAEGEKGAEDGFSPNAFIKITSQGEIVLTAHMPDMGQGVKTTLPMLIAEELEVAWEQVSVEQAEGNESRYGKQTAGGSQSVRSNYKRLRRLGAAAKEMLVAAAAKEWAVPVAECEAREGEVRHDASSRKMAYHELAGKAAKMPAPAMGKVSLKKASDFKILGKHIGGVDNEAIVKGELRYGIDQVQEGMKYASFLRCPVFGGSVEEANLDEVKALSGVSEVFIVEGKGGVYALSGGVAVVADSTWRAMQGMKALKVKWNVGEHGQASSAGLEEEAQKVIAKKKKENPGEEGSIEAVYHYPHLAHMTMEPQNCTGVFRDGHFELWAPTQSVGRAVSDFKKVFNVGKERLKINLVRCGGGFGRRLNNDFMVECGAIAKHLNGVPVKLTWTREQDIGHDCYRTAGWHHLQGQVDEEGAISSWSDNFVTLGVNGKPGTAAGMAGKEFPARYVKSYSSSRSVLDTHVPFGWLRAPGSNGIAFVVQSFIDELAHKAGSDPYEFRLKLLESGKGGFDPNRMKGALTVAAEKAGWGKPLPKGRAQGIAFHFSHRGYAAVVAEVTVSAKGELSVDRLTAGVDVGPILNRSGAEQQAIGSMLDGLSAALYQKVVIKGGAVKNKNFHDYPILRMPEVGDVEVNFVESNPNPTGLGEPLLPPTIPAVCNAVFAACGKRVRSLPISEHDLSWE